MAVQQWWRIPNGSTLRAKILTGSERGAEFYFQRFLVETDSILNVTAQEIGNGRGVVGGVGR